MPRQRRVVTKWMAFVLRETLSTFEAGLLTFLCLLLLCCMLAGNGKLQGLLRLLGAAITLTTTPSKVQVPTHLSPRARQYHASSMLHQAVASHQATNTKTKTLSQELFPSSPPVQQRLSPSKNQPLGASSHNVRRQYTSGAPNAPFRRPSQISSSNGIKRTHSGLAKALGNQGSFEMVQKPNSQQNPINVDENSPVKTSAPVVSQCEYFEEDDFDTDIDLDVEDPSTKQSIAYPSLPKEPASIPKPAFYPTLPRQQAHLQSRRTSPDDSGYGGSHTPTIFEETPISSMDIPWSSSPADHRGTPVKAKSLSDFRYKGITPQSPKKGQVPSRVTQALPPKRTLPWGKKEYSQTTQAEQNGPPLPSHSTTTSMSRATGGPEQTPLSKDAKQSAYLWNTTQSAIKEGQKTLREVNKKKSKFNEASEQALQMIQKRKSRTSVARVFLSEEQQHVLDLVAESKKSVFFTGSAGTGKSVLLREIISTLRKKHLREPDRVACTASTGLAACNIGGVTLHSFAGIGLGKEEVPELVKRIKRNQKAKHRWMRTKILIVDEISMVDGDLFDKLEAIARQIRGNGRPFGGIQLIITGDFFQLPPVPDNNKVAKFAFDAASWSTAIDHTIGLHHVFRQKDPGR